MGELSKLLLGPYPAKALRIARDTGVLVNLLPELAAVVGYEQRSSRQHLTLDEHVITVVQAAADAGAPLEVRLAALLHDLGKPQAEREGTDHAELGAQLAARVLRRLRYPAKLQQHVTRIVREHPFEELADPQPVDARRFLARHGDRLALDLLAHKAADFRGSDRSPPSMPPWPVSGARRLGLESPHRLADLAVDGNDLIAIGHREARARARSTPSWPRWSRIRAATTASSCSPARGSWRDPLVAAGPEIAFSTREGGVSDGPYESLNLGRLTGDDVERVDENRRRLCAEVGGRIDRLALNKQVSAQVHEARPGLVGRPGTASGRRSPTCRCWR